jgi:uncharacterized protein (DUF39 family)
MGGGIGYVALNGTQHVPQPERDENGLPIMPSANLALIGDMKGMDTRFVRAASVIGYTSTLAMGVGIPIPIVDEKAMRQAALADEDITYPIVEYSESYPLGRQGDLGRVSMAQLMSGHIEVDGKKVPTGGMASRLKGRLIALELKQLISRGDFTLTQATAALPGATLAWEA